MQEVLRRLSQQQNHQEFHQSLRQQLSTEPAEHYVLLQKFRQTVAEKETMIKQLKEEIQQLSITVNKERLRKINSLLTPCSTFLGQTCLNMFYLNIKAIKQVI